MSLARNHNQELWDMELTLVGRLIQHDAIDLDIAKIALADYWNDPTEFLDAAQAWALTQKKKASQGKLSL